MFMFINNNLKENAFNYCAQWSDVDDQKIDCSIIPIGAMSHTISWLPVEGMPSAKRNAQWVSGKWSVGRWVGG